MYKTCKGLNDNGIRVSLSKCKDMMYHYHGVVGRSLYKLYDMGYLSTPSVFDIYDFREVITSNFPDDIKYLKSNLSGKDQYDNPVFIKYAIEMSKDVEFKKVMNVYYDYVYASQALFDFENLLDTAKLPKRKDEFSINPRYYISQGIKIGSKTDVSNKEFCNAFYLEPDEHLVRIDLHDCMRQALFEHIGGTIEEYAYNKRIGEPFFISGVSQEKELDFIYLIASGDIEATGKYRERLVEAQNKYMRQESDAWRVGIPFDKRIFADAVSKMTQLVEEKRREFGTSGRDFYISNDEVVFAVKGEPVKKSFFEDNMLHMGTVVFCTTSKTELCKINTLNGLNGEFIHESDVRNNNWYAVGRPIPLKFGVLNGKRFKCNELNYYPLYNVFYSESESNVRPVLGNDIHVLVSDLQDVFSYFGVSDKQGLYNYFYNTVTSDPVPLSCDNNRYKGLVVDLLCGLIYAECGELDYKLVNTDYSWVMSDIFYQASTKAEDIFKSLTCF